MKNLLLASTALVASTAFAMADVDISGNAEMGVFGQDWDNSLVPTDAPLQFHTDINVTFTMAGETDAGLTFGAEVELGDAIAGGAATDNDADDGGAVIFVSGSLGTLTMGDTDGALDFALQEAIIGSAIAADHEHAGYNGNSVLDGFDLQDGQVARYDYTFGDFSFAVSAEVFDLDDSVLVGEPETTLQVGARYAGSFAGFDFGAGLGYARTNFDDGVADSDAIGVSLDTTVAGFQVILNYTDFDEVFFDYSGITGVLADANTEIDSHFGIAVGYTFGEILVAMNYGEFDVVGGGDVSGIGLVANYDLGGGAALEAGYGNSDYDLRNGVSGNAETYSFGISMDF